jgi:hypothetical protein
MQLPIQTSPWLSMDDLNVIGQYIQSETVVPLNIDKLTAEIFDFVLDGPFSRSAHHPLVVSDVSDGTAFQSVPA